MPELKVTNTHLERAAYLYIRQSTPRQVLETIESTQRQYALRERAVALGWPGERIQVIDCDLGKTGSQAAGRDGFQQLVSEVALGKAGMIMGLEVSRLARNCADWHRLMELCENAGTLILDADGLYDPALFNDKLLLGLKGELSQAELHFLKARMRGGMLNRARRGELEMRPPIGLVYLSDGSIGIDPDREVQSAVRLVFDTFERTGSAMQTVRYFHEEGLRFPRRMGAGAQKGELLWGQADHSRIVQILHNPRYAGAFVYGRTRTRRKPDGKSVSLKVPREEWQFLIRDVHPGYISWDRFEANQKRLAENRLAFGTVRRLGAGAGGTGFIAGTRAVRSLRGTHGGSLLERKREDGNHLRLPARLGPPRHQSVPACAGQDGGSSAERSLAGIGPAADPGGGAGRATGSGSAWCRNRRAASPTGGACTVRGRVSPPAIYARRSRPSPGGGHPGGRVERETARARRRAGRLPTAYRAAASPQRGRGTPESPVAHHRFSAHLE